MKIAETSTRPPEDKYRWYVSPSYCQKGAMNFARYLVHEADHAEYEKHYIINSAKDFACRIIFHPLVSPSVSLDTRRDL